jgi:hypothetical protein
MAACCVLRCRLDELLAAGPTSFAFRSLRLLTARHCSRLSLRLQDEAYAYMMTNKQRFRVCIVTALGQQQGIKLKA